MRNINKYMNLPYNYIIQQINDESGKYFYARVLEFDGCQTTGETFEEAENRLYDLLYDGLCNNAEAEMEFYIYHTE